MITIPVFNMNPIISTGIFLLFCGIGTYIIIYANMAYGTKDKKKEEKEPKVLKQIKAINRYDNTTNLFICKLCNFCMAHHLDIMGSSSLNRRNY